MWPIRIAAAVVIAGALWIMLVFITDAKVPPEWTVLIKIDRFVRGKGYNDGEGG